jgi:hypothetical protein
VLSTPLPELIHHVPEILDMPALVGRDCNGISIFLNGCTNNIQYAAVVTQMDYFSALSLDQAPHDVDRRIMAIEQRGSGNESQWPDIFSSGLRHLVSGSAHGFLISARSGLSALVIRIAR